MQYTVKASTTYTAVSRWQLYRCIVPTCAGRLGFAVQADRPWPGNPYCPCCGGEVTTYAGSRLAIGLLPDMDDSAVLHNCLVCGQFVAPMQPKTWCPNCGCEVTDAEPQAVPARIVASKCTCGSRRYRVCSEDDHLVTLECMACGRQAVYSIHSPALQPEEVRS